MFYVGSNGPTIEKDPEIQKLRQNVADRMWDIIQEETPFVMAPDAVAFISYEDALKELTTAKNAGAYNF